MKRVCFRVNKQQRICSRPYSRIRSHRFWFIRLWVCECVFVWPVAVIAAYNVYTPVRLSSNSRKKVVLPFLLPGSTYMWYTIYVYE